MLPEVAKPMPNLVCVLQDSDSKQENYNIRGGFRSPPSVDLND
jgi:hypothetical protein